MFYDLTESQIARIKSRFYPRELGQNDFLKAVILNDYGTDNRDISLRTILSVKDGYERKSNGEQLFKIFNNETSKKYLKAKLFEVLSPGMLAELSSFHDIDKIEAVINKYGAQYRDYSPSFDFLGNKTVLDAHLKLDKPEGAIELIYDTTFLLPKGKIDFLSLGLIHYFDKQAYLEDQKIDKNFIDQRILIDDLHIYNLYRDGQEVSTSVPVQDLRISTSIFKGQKVLNKLQQLNLSKALKSRLSKTGKKYFSNGYLSRNFDNTAGIAFTIDYESILKDNSAYSELFERSNLKDELISKCKITDIKIKRRLTKEVGKNKYIHTPDTETVIISSGEEKNNPTVLEKQDQSGFLGEIRINNNADIYFRSFVASDKTAFIDTNGLIQYGAEITIADSINEFLTDYADSLATHINNLKQYKQETDKIAKISQDGTYNFSVRGSYDAQKNAFTPEFLKNYDLPRGTLPPYRDIVIDAAASFVATLSLLGLEDQNNDALKRSVMLMLHPLSTNAETIIYFISLFETVISEIYRLVENNFNNTYTVKTWFTNNYIDSTESIKIGYKYFSETTHRGLALIRALDYTNRLISEVDRFRADATLDLNTAGSKVMSYLTPNNVFTKNLHLPLLNLTPDAESVTNYDFMRAEKDIKSDELQLLSAQIESPLNYFKELMNLSLIKQFNPNTSTYNKQVTNTTTVNTVTITANSATKDTLKAIELPTSPSVPTAPIVQQQIVESDYVPHQINALIEDKCRLLKESDNYRKSIEHISKYNLLFNTIQTVEVLEFKNNTLDEKWKLVTLENLENLITENIFLCRLTEYKNSALGVAGMDEIRMPVYNKYFLLSSNLYTIYIPPRITNNINDILAVLHNDLVLVGSGLEERFDITPIWTLPPDAPEEQFNAPIQAPIDIITAKPEITTIENIQTIISPTLPASVAPDLSVFNFDQPVVNEPIVTPTQLLQTTTNFRETIDISSTQPRIPNMDLISTQTATLETSLSTPTVSRLTLQTTQPILMPVRTTRLF